MKVVRCSKSTTFFREFYTLTGHTNPLEDRCVWKFETVYFFQYS